MLRAEFRKIRTVRTLMGLWIGAVVVVAVGGFSTASSISAADLAKPIHDQQSFLLASINLSLFALLVGVRSVTDEFRHGTIAWALLATTRRSRLVLAKSAVAGGSAAAIAATAVAGMVAATLLVARGKGSAIDYGAVDAGATLGLIAATAVWASIGVAVGTLIRHQVAAVVTALVWVLAIENIGAGLLREGSKFLPGQAAHSLAQVGAISELLHPAMGGLMLVLYAAALTAASIATLTRRPVYLAS